MILIWYCRFDITIGFLSGNGVLLEREWTAACHEQSLKRKEQNPTSVPIKIEEHMTHHLLLATDLAILFAKRTKVRKGLISQSEQEFWNECNSLAQRIRHFEDSWDPALKDDGKQETDFSQWLPRPRDDIVDPAQQRPFFTGELFPMNFAIMDMCAMKVIFKYKLAQLKGQQPPTQCREEAFKTAQMFEAIELCPDSRPGALLAMHQAFAMTCIFLPKDERTTMWLRRKYASLEAKGYVLINIIQGRQHSTTYN